MHNFEAIVRENIIKEMEAKKLRNKDVAKRTGMTESWVSHKLTGKREMRLGDIDLFSMAIGIHPGRIMPRLVGSLAEQMTLQDFFGSIVTAMRVGLREDLEMKINRIFEIAQTVAQPEERATHSRELSRIVELTFEAEIAHDGENLLSADPSAMDLLGLKKARVAQTKIRDIVHPDYHHVLEAKTTSVRAGEYPECAHVRLINQSTGEGFRALLVTIPVQNGKNRGFTARALLRKIEDEEHAMDSAWIKTK